MRKTLQENHILNRQEYKHSVSQACLELFFIMQSPGTSNSKQSKSQNNDNRGHNKIYLAQEKDTHFPPVIVKAKGK
jgi:hypothetical protein